MPIRNVCAVEYVTHLIFRAIYRPLRLGVVVVVVVVKVVVEEAVGRVGWVE